MIIETLTSEHEAGLLKLWQEAFGDDDAFLEAFFSTAYSADRCRCIMLDGEIAAALYWMPCEHQGKKIAYIYGVATAKAHRRKGLCHTLMADTHRTLKEQGYEGTILVPQSAELEALYSSMGYSVCSQIREFVCGPQISDLQLSQLVTRCFDLRPSSIIETLGLRRPIYAQTAAYGHFGRADLDLPWEKTDKVEELLANAR